MVAAKPLAMALAIGLFNSVAQAGGIDNGWGPDTTEFYCNVQKSDEKCGLNVLLTDQICRAYCRCDSARDKPEIKCTAYGSCSSDTVSHLCSRPDSPEMVGKAIRFYLIFS